MTYSWVLMMIALVWRTTAWAQESLPAFGPPIVWGPLPEGKSHILPLRVVDLQHQTIHVRFDWPRHAVIGSTTLRVAAVGHPLSAIVLDAVNMKIGEARVRTQSVQTKYDGQSLVIPLPKPLGVGDTVSVSVDYETVAPTSGVTFVDRKHVVWTQSWAIDARAWLPTIDRINDKTTWESFVTVPKAEKALSNGRLVGTRDIGDQQEWHWAQEKPASPYLMAIIAGEYTVIPDAWDGIPIGYWAYPEAVDVTKRAFGVTPKAIQLFSQVTGVRYPWAKYDQIIAPDFNYGGMENVTATVQNDETILNMAHDSLADAQGLVAHELSHQWFGDLVTPLDFDEVWLSEGFAQFMTTVYFEKTGQHDRAMLLRLSDQMAARDIDRVSRRPLVFGRWVTTPIEVYALRHPDGALSSGMIYVKGAAVLSMLRETVGEKAFWTAINVYLKGHAYGSVTSRDLRRAFEQTTRRNLSSFFDQWVYGAGYPVLQITQQYNKATQRLTLTIKQVQPRDSLTGLFTMNVGVDVVTDRGVIHGVAHVRERENSLTLKLPAPPKAIMWDPNSRWYALVDFPRPTSMVLYQLQHGNVIERTEAIQLLQSRLMEDDVRSALTKVSTEDSVREIRMRAAAVLQTRGPGATFGH